MWIFNYTVETFYGIAIVLGMSVVAAGAAYEIMNQAIRGNWTPLATITALAAFFA